MEQPQKLDAVPVGPSRNFIAVDAITRIGEENGWPSREAFFLAVMLHASGVTPLKAAQLFRESGKWLQ
jgi:hypothetical protein